ncbi:MAG: SDR family oxidoreductase [Rhodobacteraceae bacterium]|nr:SDR family oxidoreductase [Paracoccaceae bacterium]
MKNLLKDKRIIVTGSSSGIGWETCGLLAEQGAEVIGVDVNKNFDHVAEFYRTDLSDPGTVDALIDVLPKNINGLVNNAGLPPTKDANLLLRVNLLSLKRLTLGLIPKMSDGASIVNVASLAGFGWSNAVDAIKASGDFLQTLGARAEEDRRVMDRPGTPKDIAPVIAFLLSDLSSWIRGTNIPTDGGMSSNILCGLHEL